MVSHAVFGAQTLYGSSAEWFLRMYTGVWRHGNETCLWIVNIAQRKMILCIREKMEGMKKRKQIPKKRIIKNLMAIFVCIGREDGGGNKKIASAFT